MRPAAFAGRFQMHSLGWVTRSAYTSKYPILLPGTYRRPGQLLNLRNRVEITARTSTGNNVTHYKALPDIVLLQLGYVRHSAHKWRFLPETQIKSPAYDRKLTIDCRI